MEKLYQIPCHPPILLDNKVAEEICVFAEYLKRKFWLDCVVEKRDGKYLKSGSARLYSMISFKSFDDLLSRIGEIFDIHIKSGSIFVYNPGDIYERVFHKRKSIYYIIRYLYKAGYKLFLKHIRHGIQKGIFSFEDPTLKQDEVREFSISPYFYESILYHLSDYRKSLEYGNNLYGKFINCCINQFQMLDNAGTYRVFIEMLSKYYLNMVDLLRMAEPESIIVNDYKLDVLPRFMFLPRIDFDNHKLGNLIKSYPDATKNNLCLSLNFSESTNIRDLSEFAKNVVTYFAYMYKSSFGVNLTQDEYNYISSYMLSPVVHNKTDSFVERIDGLYLWDKIYYEQSKLSINDEIRNFLAKFKNYSFVEKDKNTKKLEKSSLAKYQRLLKRTTECIEKGRFLPIC